MSDLILPLGHAFTAEPGDGDCTTVVAGAPCDAEADDHAAREPFYCDAETPATREDPAEYCEELVDHEGDLCPRHEPADEPEFERGDEW